MPLVTYATRLFGWTATQRGSRPTGISARLMAACFLLRFSPLVYEARLASGWTPPTRPSAGVGALVAEGLGVAGLAAPSPPSPRRLAVSSPVPPRGGPPATTAASLKDLRLS